MEKKWKWFIGILALFIFIGGAYLLYETFADDFATGGLVVNTTASLPESSQAADTSQTLPPAETTSTSLPAPRKRRKPQREKRHHLAKKHPISA